MRAGDKAGFLEVGHDVADGGRRQVETGKFRQRARADRLAVGDVVFDQGLEESAGAIIEHVRALYKKLAAARAAIFMQEFGP